MSLSDIEKGILAEGEKVVALARKGALEVRKLNLLAVLDDIEAELKKLEGVLSPSKKAAAPKEEAPKEEASEEEAPKVDNGKK